MTADRLFHAVGALLGMVLLVAAYVGREWGVMLIWSVMEAYRGY